MSVLIAMCLMWMGVLYHHYPVITGKKLDAKLGNRFVKFYFIGALGLLYSFAAGGAMGMPRRFADWSAGPDGWMMVGISILIFGILLIVGFATYMQNFLRSRSIS